MMAHLKINFLLVLALICFSNCTKDKGELDYSYTSYPKDIANIIVNKCATAGCHNDKSKNAAGGISLSSWDKLFEGNGSGSIVIPYRPDFSTLCYYINTKIENGPSLQPTMPLNDDVLTDEEYQIIKNWIITGAPSNKGVVKYSDDPRRKKIYVANQICDVITVFDSQTLLPMRYIDVGETSTQEFPITIKVAPDGNNWYVSFLSQTSLIQKFDARTDSYIGKLDLGSGVWTTFDISADSRYGYFVDNSSPGKIAYVDLNSLQLLATYTFGGNFIYPKNAVVNSSGTKLIVGTEQGNFVYILDISDPMNPTVIENPIDGSADVLHNQSNDPQFLKKTKDDKYCFIGCTFSNDIRIMDLQTNSIFATISLPSNPQQMDVYDEYGLLFVTCPEDVTSFSGNRGSVLVINYLNNTIVKYINSGFQPYGLGVVRSKKMIAIANSNLDSGGPAPHHSTVCGGRNGYVTFIDATTLELVSKKRIEVAVFPRCISVRD
jgi:DNA-binding beta-propeller fold protein YncE